MAGMEALGRVYNVIPIAGGVAVSLKQASGVGFLVTNSAINPVFSVTIATSFGGTYRAGSFFSPAWTPINHYYLANAQNGTAAWTRVSQTAADNITYAANTQTAYFEILASQLPDTYDYIKCTNSGGAGLVTAIVHDLTVQRKPANLAILSA